MERRSQFDEMRAADGKVRPHFGPIADWLAKTPAKRWPRNVARPTSSSTASASPSPSTATRMVPTMAPSG